MWKKSKGDIIFWRDSNLTVCNPFLLPNKKAIQFFDVQRILQFSSWSTGYYQDYTARLLLSISDFRFCKKGKLYHPKGTFTNYIDQFWPILDYLPKYSLTPSWQIWRNCRYLLLLLRSLFMLQHITHYYYYYSFVYLGENLHTIDISRDIYLVLST